MNIHRSPNGKVAIQMKKQECTIAIGFFGIPRSIKHTQSSIQKNIIDSIGAEYQFKIYSAFILQEQISNPRTGEFLAVSREDYGLIKSSHTQLISEHDEELQKYFLSLKGYGDILNDNFRSLNNLVNQLSSLQCLTDLFEEEAHKVCVFVRPDLKYHDSILPVVKSAINCSTDTVFLPDWEPWRGYNDRFAVCYGEKAIRAYGKRLRMSEQYCKHSMSPLNSHRLLKYALEQEGIVVKKISTRATRVRADGTEAEENFTCERNYPVHIKIKNFILESGVKLSELTRTKRFLRSVVRFQESKN